MSKSPHGAPRFPPPVSAGGPAAPRLCRRARREVAGGTSPGAAKGVAPPHVTLNQIFAGMMPFMGIQILAIILLYQFPAIGLWLPELLYK